MNDENHLLDEELLAALAPGLDSEVLRHALTSQRPPEERRVYVNRTLRMDSIRFVGFDLDWTLADYHRDRMSQLAFERTLDRLVERHGYPKAVLEAEFRADFLRRGLMMDLETGMVVKMNRHRYVGRAYHGRHYLEPDHRARLYRKELINPASRRFHFVDTLFELPEVNIFSELVELSEHDERKVELPGYARVCKDVRAAIDTIHADGSLKAAILAALPRYLPRDPELVLALRRMALGGQRLLLITNSEWYYTDALCRHLFEGTVPGLDNWRDLFDLVIVSAAKPGFFRKERPFVELDDKGEPSGETSTPQWSGIYAGGCREGLMRLFQEPGEHVLYVGDHIYGDILSSKLASTWRTALVVSELEDELKTRARLVSQQRHLDVLRAEFVDLGQRMDGLKDVFALAGEMSENGTAPLDEAALERTRAAIAELRGENRVMRHQAKRLQARISQAINPYWGSLFKQGESKSFFGAQVDDFACLYTSRVSNFSFYGSLHYHRVQRDPMIHEMEF